MRRPKSTTGTESAGGNRLRSVSPLWFLAAAMAVAAYVVYAAAVGDLGTLSAEGVHLPWFVLAAGFALADRNVVHLHFRGEAHAFSLSEIVLVVGLFFTAPSGFLLAQMVGCGVVMLVCDRMPLLKLAYNLSQLALGSVLAIVVFRAVSHTGGPLDHMGWIAAIVACAVAMVVTLVAITVAVAVMQRHFASADVVRSFGFGVLSACANTMMGLIVVIVCWRSLPAAALLVGPIVVMLVAYRAYLSERAKSAGLQFLYSASEVLNQADDADDGLVALLEFARDAFHAELAEIVVIGSDDDPMGYRTAAGPDDEVARMAATARAIVEPMVATANATSKAVVLSGGEASVAARDGFEISSMMLAPLRGESGVRGAALIACSSGSSREFDKDDLSLFETFVNHLATTLDKSQLSTSLAELRVLKQELTHQAYHDSLTGLPNRALFRDRVDAALAASAYTGGTAVMFIDLDDFKTVNDTMGHAAGDALLEVVGRRISESIGPDHLAARLGGDEFAVLLHGIAHDADASAIAERILVALGDPIILDGQSVIAQASIGIASHAGARDADELMKNADVAMYTAKRNGKGRSDVFEATMSLSVARRHQIKTGLDRALANHELVVQYQPVVEASSGDIVAAEALVRWKHPERGLLPPSEFITIAEETGQIMPIGRFVIGEACRQAAAWSVDSPGLRMFVNLSTRQLADDALLDDVRAALADNGLLPEQLTLEVTETEMMHDFDAAREALLALKALGVRIAIDDFGTGFSSLSYLRTLPIDVLKIAKPFVDGIGDSDADTAFVRGIVELGHVVGAEVVAEGVERVDQYAHLVDMGCDLVQGYYYSRSLDPAAFEALLYNATTHCDERAELASIAGVC